MIIPIAELRGLTTSEIVELSGWGDEDTFVCKLRRAGIFDMQIKGDIPCPILEMIQRVLSREMYEEKTYPEYGQQTARAFYYIARACLVWPTMDTLEDIGIYLTERQLAEIYVYRVGGIPMLKKYRESKQLQIVSK